MIIIDNINIKKRIGRIDGTWNHMTSNPYNQLELKEFARKLGLKDSWFQCKTKHKHYDITLPIKLQAIKLGAKAVSWREYVKLVTKDMQEKNIC